ncbi:myeloid-associated differentiation marker-like protein [Alligator mississippiensis]|uniref:Myeloid-associated differentiation marker-like protein n=1 Tax=Alligator mississippiensis TaxID=8496 RepID=A0A151NW62_ALLMI|nr:myeloid-associated differentiation marker-like protein [Alligator mississippiensis]
MPVQRFSSVGNTQALTSLMVIMHLLEALFTCITFSLVASHGGRWGGNGEWCVFSWCFCFAVTVVVLLVEFLGLQHRMPISWKNFPEVTGYVATVPGLLKVVETIIACIIFAFINNPVPYDWHEALKWCLAVYCICFILSLAVLCIRECTIWMPCAFNKFLSGYVLLAVLLYATVTILWPLYNFNRKHGKPKWPKYCQDHTFCSWDNLVVIAMLTAINLLVYLADLVYSASSSSKPRVKDDICQA